MPSSEILDYFEEYLLQSQQILHSHFHHQIVYMMDEEVPPLSLAGESPTKIMLGDVVEESGNKYNIPKYNHSCWWNDMFFPSLIGKVHEDILSINIKCDCDIRINAWQVRFDTYMKSAITAIEKFRARIQNSAYDDSPGSVENLALYHAQVSFIKIVMGESDDTRWIIRASILSHKTLSNFSPIIPWSLWEIALILYQSYHTTVTMATIVARIIQRTPEWMKIRSGWCDSSLCIMRGPLISSSVVGEILGHVKAEYKKKNDQSYEVMWIQGLRSIAEHFGQCAMERGTASEPVILKNFVMKQTSYIRRYRPIADVCAEEVGIQICMCDPCKAASPDLILHVFDPMTMETFYCSGEMKCRPIEFIPPYPTIPLNYHDQIQHTDDILRTPESFFICQASEIVSVERFEFNKKKWKNYCVRIEEYYWEKIFPAIVMKSFGLLEGYFPIIKSQTDTSFSDAKNKYFPMIPMPSVILFGMRSRESALFRSVKSFMGIVENIHKVADENCLNLGDVNECIVADQRWSILSSIFKIGHPSSLLKKGGIPWTKLTSDDIDATIQEFIGIQLGSADDAALHSRRMSALAD